jgi:hypothetical protein
MRRRLLGLLLLMLLTPFAGLGWFLMGSLRMVVARVERVFLLGGLTLALSLPSPLTAQLSQAGATHDVQMALSWVLAVLGTVLLGAGATRPWLKRVRYVLRHRGWSF